MKRSRPNILLITADSLRADRFGYCGYARPVSPHLDKLAKTSTVFTRAFSNGPNTPHAFPAIMASRCSLLSSKLGLFDPPLTLAEILRDLDYRTAGFNAGNPYVSGYFGYDRGFEEFQDYIDFDATLPLRANSKRSQDNIISIPGLDMERYLITEDNIRAKAYLEERFVQDVIEWLGTVRNEPFFLWLHFMDTHYPYLPQRLPQEKLNQLIISKEENFALNTAVRENSSVAPEKSRKISMLYDACIYQLDEKIGRLLTHFAERSLFEDLMIVFCSDHGEEFLEHGDFQHKSKLFDELIHIPLMIKLPGQVTGAAQPACVSSLQIAPTILRYLSVDNPFENDSLLQQAEFHGIFAAASVGVGGNAPTEQNMFETDRLPKTYALRTATHKLILNTGDDRELLFDLMQDPVEEVSVYENGNKNALRMETQLIEHIIRLEEQRVRESVMRKASRLNSKMKAEIHAL